MLLAIAPEHRSIIDKLKVTIITDVPSNTPPHIRARLQAGIAAVCEKRSLTPVEERSYQEAAMRFNVNRPVVKARQTAEKKITAAPTTIDLRHGALALRYKALSYEQIKRAVKFNYSVDVLNALNVTAIGKQIR